MHLDWNWYIVLAILAVFVVIRFRRRKQVVTYRIHNPVVGFANYGGSEFADLVRADSAAIGPLFNNSIVSQDSIPTADVIFLYASLDASGHLVGPEYLRSVGLAADARLVVLATSAGDFQDTLLGPDKVKYAGLVVTMDRNGDAFTKFFSLLFQAMRSGKNISMAWVEIHPQVPVQENPDAPELVYITDGVTVEFVFEP